MTAPAGMPWKTVTALAFSQLVAWGILYYAFAVIQTPMGLENKWTMPQMNGAFSLALAISGLSAYHVGRHIDRQGGRRVMFVGALLAAAGLCGWSQATALWHFYLAMAVVGVAASMTLYEAAFAVVARLAPTDYRRGITTITLLGGLASTCFIPLTHFLVEYAGWRATLLVFAAIMVMICAAIPLFMLSPSVRAAPAEEEKPSSVPVYDIVKHMPAFWLLIVAYVSHAFFYTALLFNLLPFLAERGFSSDRRRGRLRPDRTGPGGRPRGAADDRSVYEHGTRRHSGDGCADRRRPSPDDHRARQPCSDSVSASLRLQHGREDRGGRDGRAGISAAEILRGFAGSDRVTCRFGDGLGAIFVSAPVDTRRSHAPCERSDGARCSLFRKFYAGSPPLGRPARGSCCLGALWQIQQFTVFFMERHRGPAIEQVEHGFARAAQAHTARGTDEGAVYEDRVFDHCSDD